MAPIPDEVMSKQAAGDELELVVFESDPVRAAQLENAVEGCQSIRVAQLAPKDRRSNPGLDALYLTIPMAEEWGARPLLYQAQILPTSDTDRAQGLPPFIVAGVAVSGRDRLAPGEFLDLDLTDTVSAVRKHNAEHGIQIRVIGIFSDHLFGHGLSAADVGARLRKTFCGGRTAV